MRLGRYLSRKSERGFEKKASSSSFSFFAHSVIVGYQSGHEFIVNRVTSKSWEGIPGGLRFSCDFHLDVKLWIWGLNKGITISPGFYGGRTDSGELMRRQEESRGTRQMKLSTSLLERRAVAVSETTTWTCFEGREHVGCIIWWWQRKTECWPPGIACHDRSHTYIIIFSI